MPMILEGIVTTQNDDGRANVSPMGPIVEDDWRGFTLRPFQSSRTYRNLKRRGEGVLHVTDDVELFAAAAINALPAPPAMHRAERVEGWILNEACRWYAFQVEQLDDSQPRTEIQCRVLDHGRQRDFFGFNRAKHAVIEAAILATRLELIPYDEICDAFERLAAPVEKTAGDAERRAFQLLQNHVDSYRKPA